jgi:negative regulator of flagellin synthesis FlgM
MKVDPNLSSNIQRTGLNKSDALAPNKADKQDKSNATATLGEINSSSKVDISETAQRMKMAQEIASTPSTVNEAKVARLQKLIDAGEYKVNAEAVADKLVDEHLLMST